ncbi:MFS transporter [Pseudoduganella chitinolytica]|uniref:MFS transporter n=1 Tax=Pseudoduganella chitinolytica TaxID=34070 RepID=A0ABY8BDJ9_9BURK|nr:MFS transporter [Pseudoduganella chitinolytica]WEF33989.1 MFS transporter [Pseudoduganella chitinolytica]
MKTPILIAAACLLALLSTVGTSLPYPILPPLFASGAVNGLNSFLGLPPKLLFGIALTVNPVGLLIGATLLGPVSDRYGRRPVLLATAFGAAAGHAVTALALVLESFPLFIAARFITGLMEGNSAVARALLAERLAGQERVRALSLLNGAFHLGWLVGPLLAGLTVGFGITVPFIVAIVALVLAGVLVMIAVPSGRHGAGAEPGQDSLWQVARRNNVLHLLRHPPLRTLFAIQLACSCGITAFYDFFPLWLVEVGGYDTARIAIVNTALCGVMTGAAVVAGRVRTGDPLRQAAWYACAIAAAVAGVALGNLWVGIGAIVLFGIPNAFYNATMQPWAAERFAAHGQGAVMGLLSTTFCLASIVTALAGSWLVLVDTRLVLGTGAMLSLWAGWRLRRWHAEVSVALPVNATT